VLPTGRVHPDLVGRLAGEAARSAGHVLTMCIRALDYLPPVDVTFFDYLRARITADYDLVRDDRNNYRVAVVLNPVVADSGLCYSVASSLFESYASPCATSPARSTLCCLSVAPYLVPRATGPLFRHP
jgi:hypothetical protein